METIKIKFVGKYPGYGPNDSTICYWLMKNGYHVEVSEDPDYIICDIFGDEPYAFCRYPQVRIFESGENVTPPFDLVDYAVCRYPIQFGDRCIYQPGCGQPGAHWHALAKKDRNYPASVLEEKPYFANMIASHDSEYENRSRFFKLMNDYKRVESPGTFMNNLVGGGKLVRQ